MIYVKGNMVSYMPIFIRERFGEYGLKKWTQSLQYQAHDIYGMGVKKDEWYPLKIALTDPMGKACDQFYYKGIRGCIDLGWYIADQEKRKEVKLLPFKTPPMARIKKACEVMRSNFDSIGLEVLETHDGKAIIRMMLHENIDTIDVLMAGWTQRTAEHALGTAVGIEITHSNEDRQVEYLLGWKTA